MAKHKIALIPGDGIGKEVLPEGVRVLEAAARRFNFQLEFTDFDWSCDRLLQTGKMMPEDGMEQLKAFESIFLGAVGWPGVPDHVSLWGLLIPIRRDFDEYVNLRPVRLFEGVPSPLANRKPGEIDFWVVRENTEGEYSQIGGRMFQGTDDRVRDPGGDLHAQGRRPRAEVRLRVREQGQEEARDVGHQVQRHHPHDAVLGRALRRDEEELSRHQGRPVPHRHPDRALRAQSRLVRRRGRLQPVRRHPVGPRPRAHRLDRRGAVGQHQPRAQVPVDVRAGARLGARTSPASGSPIRSARSGRAP